MSATTKTSIIPTSGINTENEEKKNSTLLEALIASAAFLVTVAFAVGLICYFRGNNVPCKTSGNESKFFLTIFVIALILRAAVGCSESLLASINQLCCCNENEHVKNICFYLGSFIAELSRARSARSGAPWVREIGNPWKQENLVMT